MRFKECYRRVLPIMPLLGSPPFQGIRAKHKNQVCRVGLVMPAAFGRLIPRQCHTTPTREETCAFVCLCVSAHGGYRMETVPDRHVFSSHKMNFRPGCLGDPVRVTLVRPWTDSVTYAWFCGRWNVRARHLER
jgi:hypothetical protein